MSDFNFDVGAELSQARGKKPGAAPAPQPERKPTNVPSRPPVSPPVGKKPTVAQGNAGTAAPRPTTRPVTPQPPPTTPTIPEPEGFGVTHERPSPSGGGGGKAKPQGRVDYVGWKEFQPLPGIFKFVGGERPVVLDDIDKGSVSGVPEQVLFHTQRVLKERFHGATVSFPWGTYMIDERNLVFSQKSTTVRYLLFDALRDDAGTHVQYAKQWFALHHPTGFDPDFDPRRHMKSAQDELDIYALLFVAHLDAPTGAVSAPVVDGHLDDKLDLLTMNMKNILERMANQERQVEAHFSRQQTLETVLLLDRLGLIKGGLPKDPGDLVRLLEVNRDLIRDTGDIIDGHVEAETDRQKRLAREARLKEHLRRQAP